MGGASTWRLMVEGGVANHKQASPISLMCWLVCWLLWTVGGASAPGKKPRPHQETRHTKAPGIEPTTSGAAVLFHTFILAAFPRNKRTFVQPLTCLTSPPLADRPKPPAPPPAPLIRRQLTSVIKSLNSRPGLADRRQIDFPPTSIFCLSTK